MFLHLVNHGDLSPGGVGQQSLASWLCPERSLLVALVARTWVCDLDLRVQPVQGFWAQCQVGGCPPELPVCWVLVRPPPGMVLNQTKHPVCLWDNPSTVSTSEGWGQPPTVIGQPVFGSLLWSPGHTPPRPPRTSGGLWPSASGLT